MQSRQRQQCSRGGSAAEEAVQQRRQCSRGGSAARVCSPGRGGSVAEEAVQQRRQCSRGGSAAEEAVEQRRAWSKGLLGVSSFCYILICLRMCADSGICTHMFV